MFVRVGANGDIYSANSSETSVWLYLSGFCAFLSWELFQLWFCYDQRKREETSLVLEGEIKKQRELEREREREENRSKK